MRPQPTSVSLVFPSFCFAASARSAAASLQRCSIYVVRCRCRRAWRRRTTRSARPLAAQQRRRRCAELAATAPPDGRAIFLAARTLAHSCPSLLHGSIEPVQRELSHLPYLVTHTQLVAVKSPLYLSPIVPAAAASAFREPGADAASKSRPFEAATAAEAAGRGRAATATGKAAAAGAAAPQAAAGCEEGAAGASRAASRGAGPDGSAERASGSEEARRADRREGGGCCTTSKGVLHAGVGPLTSGSLRPPRTAFRACGDARAAPIRCRLRRRRRRAPPSARRSAASSSSLRPRRPSPPAAPPPPATTARPGSAARPRGPRCGGAPLPLPNPNPSGLACIAKPAHTPSSLSPRHPQEARRGRRGAVVVPLFRRIHQHLRAPHVRRGQGGGAPHPSPCIAPPVPLPPHSWIQPQTRIPTFPQHKQIRRDWSTNCFERRFAPVTVDSVRGDGDGWHLAVLQIEARHARHAAPRALHPPRRTPPPPRTGEA